MSHDIVINQRIYDKNELYETLFHIKNLIDVNFDLYKTQKEEPFMKEGWYVDNKVIYNAVRHYFINNSFQRSVDEEHPWTNTSIYRSQEESDLHLFITHFIGGHEYLEMHFQPNIIDCPKTKKEWLEVFDKLMFHIVHFNDISILTILLRMIRILETETAKHQHDPKQSFETGRVVLKPIVFRACYNPRRHNDQNFQKFIALLDYIYQHDLLKGEGYHNSYQNYHHNDIMIHNFKQSEALDFVKKMFGVIRKYKKVADRIDSYKSVATFRKPLDDQEHLEWLRKRYQEVKEGLKKENE